MATEAPLNDPEMPRSHLSPAKSKKKLKEGQVRRVGGGLRGSMDFGARQEINIFRESTPEHGDQDNEFFDNL